MFRSLELLLKNSHLKEILGAKKEWRLNDFKILDVSVGEGIEWVCLFAGNEQGQMLELEEEREKLLQEERNKFLSLLLLLRKFLNLLNKSQPNGYNLKEIRF